MNGQITQKIADKTGSKATFEIERSGTRVIYSLTKPVHGADHTITVPVLGNLHHNHDADAIAEMVAKDADEQFKKLEPVQSPQTGNGMQTGTVNVAVPKEAAQSVTVHNPLPGNPGPLKTPEGVAATGVPPVVKP